MLRILPSWWWKIEVLHLCQYIIVPHSFDETSPKRSEIPQQTRSWQKHRTQHPSQKTKKRNRRSDNK